MWGLEVKIKEGSIWEWRTIDGRVSYPKTSMKAIPGKMDLQIHSDCVEGTANS